MSSFHLTQLPWEQLEANRHVLTSPLHGPSRPSSGAIVFLQALIWLSTGLHLSSKTIERSRYPGRLLEPHGNQRDVGQNYVMPSSIKAE